MNTQRAYEHGFKSLPGSGSPYLGWRGLQPLHQAYERGQSDADKARRAPNP